MKADVTPHDRIKALIDAASVRIGNQYRMGKLIGYSTAEVSLWKAGARPCPPEAQVLMAQAAGFDPAEVLAIAIIERHANTTRGEKLLTALGKALHPERAAASLITSASAVWGLTEAGSYLTRCIQVLMPTWGFSQRRSALFLRPD
jgi:DNA-binding transcriptional regulator YdaS (Cro superfamily)